MRVGIVSLAVGLPTTVRSLRSLPQEGARPEPATWAACGDGQPFSHKGERVRELIEGRGCELVYLLPYSSSPDLNPIEEAFSETKGFIRKAEARTREGLWWKRWELRSGQSRLGMRAVFSSTAGTLHQFNLYDERCILPNLALAHQPESS